MKRVILLSIFLVMLSLHSVFAQSFRVKGKVIDQESNEPLIGVSILQEGSNHGVITNYYGDYDIEIKGAVKATLVFSYIGMQEQRLTD